MNEPIFRLPAKVTNIHDGDTISVEVKFSFPVRILDLWAPELHSSDPKENFLGAIARKDLVDIIGSGNVLLEIPWSNAIGEMFTFGRVISKVLVGSKELYQDLQNVSDLMHTKGHVGKTKAEEMKIISNFILPSGASTRGSH